MEEEKKNPKIELSYEVKMYHLLIIFIASVFIAIGIGALFGNSLGYQQGIDAVSIETPSYCHTQNEGHDNVKVVCNEMENVTLAQLCQTLSTPLEHKLKILIAN